GRRREGGDVGPAGADLARNLPWQCANSGSVQHFQGRQGRRLPRDRGQSRARRKGQADSGQRRHPRGYALHAEAVQGRGARGAGRAGVRYGLCQLPGYPRRRRHRMLQCREHRPDALDVCLPLQGVGTWTRRPLFPSEFRSMSKRHSGKTTGPSQRQLRVGELVRHALAEMLARGEIHDEVLASHVLTIPEVRMSPDLRLATIFVMPLGGKDIEAVLAALENNKRYIRGEVARAVNLKFAPEVRFRADQTFDEALRIDRLLASDKVRQDLDKR